MSDDKSKKAGRLVFLGSIAVNIFFGAFLLGRLTLPGMMMPLPPPFGMGGDGMVGGPPPLSRMEGHGHGPMPPPSPFFGPSSLFSEEEMREGFVAMQATFKKIGILRSDFAQKLKDGPVGRGDILKHFDAIDRLMDSVKKQTQERAAEKISAMSPDERERFADRLLREAR